MALKQEMTGDGRKFFTACKLSGKRDTDIFEAMGISNASYYRLFSKPELSEKMKAAAAKALGRTVDDIFGGDQSMKQPVATQPTYEQKYIDLLESNKRMYDMMVSMQQTIISMMGPIADTQRILSETYQNQTDTMRKMHDRVVDVRNEVMGINLKLKVAQEYHEANLIETETVGDYITGYISHKTKIEPETARKTYLELRRAKTEQARLSTSTT